jgi:hypothetical protein
MNFPTNIHIDYMHTMTNFVQEKKSTHHETTNMNVRLSSLSMWILMPLNQKICKHTFDVTFRWLGTIINLLKTRISYYPKGYG